MIVAGDGIGMAPGARFIAARVFNDAGVSTDSGIHPRLPVAARSRRQPGDRRRARRRQCLVGRTTGSCDREFEPDLQALRAAHILPVFAAGNDGRGSPLPDTSPANLPEAFAVGAAADATTIAPFSSAGPSRCDGGQFPSLVAAGTGIRSTGRLRLRRDGPRGHVVRGAARRGRARAAAPGRPAAHRRRAGEPAARRAQPTSARRARTPRSAPASLDVVAAARAALPDARLRPSGAVGAGGQRRDAPGARR